MPSKPAHAPTRPDADDNDAQVSDHERRIIEERLARPEGPTRPWEDVLADLRARRSIPPLPR